MATNVTALYKDPVAARLAVDRLLASGFGDDDLSVLMSEDTRGRAFGLEEHTKAPEGAVSGAVAGGALGGLAAALVAVGVIAAPGIGLLAAGPVLATLAGVGAGGAAGGLIGALAGMGFSEHEAKLYSDEVAEGAILIGVHAHSDRKDQVKEIFEDTGGHHIRT